MIEKIIELVALLLKAIPIVNRWFTEPPSEKIEEDKKKLDELEQEFRKSGRPKP